MVAPIVIGAAALGAATLGGAIYSAYRGSKDAEEARRIASEQSGVANASADALVAAAQGTTDLSAGALNYIGPTNTSNFAAYSDPKNYETTPGYRDVIQHGAADLTSVRDQLLAQTPETIGSIGSGKLRADVAAAQPGQAAGVSAPTVTPTGVVSTGLGTRDAFVGEYAPPKTTDVAQIYNTYRPREATVDYDPTSVDVQSDYAARASSDRIRAAGIDTVTPTTGVTASAALPVYAPTQPTASVYGADTGVAGEMQAGRIDDVDTVEAPDINEVRTPTVTTTATPTPVSTTMVGGATYQAPTVRAAQPGQAAQVAQSPIVEATTADAQEYVAREGQAATGQAASLGAANRVIAPSMRDIAYYSPETLGGPTPQMQAAGIGDIQSAQAAQLNQIGVTPEQQQLLQALQAQALGTGTSIADLEAQRAREAAQQQQLSLLASTRGDANAGLAQRRAGENIAAATQQINRDAMIARVSEQQQAQQLLNQIYGGLRGQDIQQATTQANLTQQAQMQTAENMNTAIMRQAELEQAAGERNLGVEETRELANLQASNEARRAWMDAQNQAQLQNQQMQLETGRLNQAAQLQEYATRAGLQQEMGLANMANQQQMELANIGAFNQASQFGAGAYNALSQANQQAALQAALANQAVGQQTNLTQADLNQQLLMQNLANRQQANVLNQQFDAQALQFGAGQHQQAALANQQAMLQSALANQQAGMQQGQFNAEAFNQAQMLRAQLQRDTEAQRGQLGFEADRLNQAADLQVAVRQAELEQAASERNLTAEETMELANIQSTNQQREFNALGINQMNVLGADQQLQAALANQQAQQQANMLTAQQQQATNMALKQFDMDRAMESAQLQQQANVQDAQLNAQMQQFNAMQQNTMQQQFADNQLQSQLAAQQLQYQKALQDAQFTQEAELTGIANMQQQRVRQAELAQQAYLQDAALGAQSQTDYNRMLLEMSQANQGVDFAREQMNVANRQQAQMQGRELEYDRLGQLGLQQQQMALANLDVDAQLAMDNAARTDAMAQFANQQTLQRSMYNADTQNQFLLNQAAAAQGLTADAMNAQVMQYQMAAADQERLLNAMAQASGIKAGVSANLMNTQLGIQQMQAQGRNQLIGSGISALGQMGGAYMMGAASDVRAKENFKSPVAENEALLDALKDSKSYNYKDSQYGPTNQLSTGAMANLLPESVTTQMPNGMMGVDIPRFTTALGSAVGQQQKEIDELRMALTALAGGE